MEGEQHDVLADRNSTRTSLGKNNAHTQIPFHWFIVISVSSSAEFTFKTGVKEC